MQEQECITMRKGKITWIFDSAPSGNVFLIWSDGYKKHPWKGTFYEVIANPDHMDVRIPHEIGH